MDERHLLLLGVLMAQSQHAYRINEFIETNLGRVSNMKRATAYALLERLEKRGLVSMDVQAIGRHPPRKVYSITEAGKSAFLDLLQKVLLRVEETSSAADIAFMFIDYLPADEAIALLEKRAEELQRQIVRFRSTPHHTSAPGVDYAVQRRIKILQAERSWLDEALHALMSGGAEGRMNGGTNGEGERA